MKAEMGKKTVSVSSPERQVNSYINVITLKISQCMTYLVVLQKLFQLSAVVDFILSCLDGLKGVEDVECPQVKLMLEQEEVYCTRANILLH